MANMQVTVVDGNNITVTLDRGVAGVGISSVELVTIDSANYLLITYTNGTTDTVGPVGIIQYNAVSPITITGAEIGLDTVPVAKGGTGQITANAGFNALAPAQATHAGKYLKTDGTNAAWDQLDISTADITGTLPVLNGGTGVTTSTGTGSVVLSTSPALTTPTGIVKNDVGLGNVDNTSDANKPVSTAQATAIGLKVTANADITGATKTKITYDAKGLVTSGTDATTADIADSTNKRYVTDAQILAFHGVNDVNTSSASAAQGVKADSALQPGAIGVTVQAYDADLTTWAGITPGTGVGTALANTAGAANGVATYNQLGTAAFTAASTYVPYSGATGAVDLNGQHLVNTDHIGVGTSVSPNIPVRVVANNDSLSRIAIRGYSSDANSSSMRVSKFRGTVGAPQVPQNADSLGKFEVAGYATTSADALPGASLEGVATETWGATAHGTKLLVKVTPNTTTTQATAITIDQDKSVSLAGALSVTGHTTFEGITSTGATGTGKLVYDTSPTLVTPSLGVASATSLAITGTAGAGFQTFVGQSSNPTSPAAGTLLVHSKTVNGFTRLEQDNESATNVVYGRDNVFIAENPTGSTIPKGSTVYVSGTVSGAPQVQLARANSSSTLPCVGITTDAILAGGFGQVMYAGLLTFDTTAFSTGNQVWVSTSTAGALTATRPSGTTNSAQRMGTILVSGNSTTGLMLVQTSPALLNMETGTNAATWTGTAVSLGGQLTSTVATGTAPFVVASTTQVANLNAATAGAVAVGGVTGLGTGVATALAVNVGSAGAPVVNGGALGTPSSGSAANLTSFPTLNQNTTGTAATVTGATQASITSAANLVTVGALNSGSITSGFGAIDVGADAISGGAMSATGIITGRSTNGQVFTATNAADSTLSVDIAAGDATIYQLGSASTLGFGIGSTRRLQISSTGLAVTGALSATGLLSTSDTTEATSTTAASLKTAGGLAVAKKAYFGDTLYMAAGKGIDFSANSDAGRTVTANLFSDYEEGTWTVTVGGDATYTGAHTGNYTKIGRKVDIDGGLTINVLGTGSPTNIQGAPFTPIANGAASISYFSNLAVNTTALYGYVNSANTNIYFCTLATADASVVANASIFGNGAGIRIGATYFT